MTPLEFALCAAGFYLLYCIHFELTVGVSRRKTINERGCKPAVVFKHKDPILGIDLVRDIAARSKAGTILQGSQERFKKYGNTLQMNLLGRWIIITSEPQNIKTMLALNFSDYSLGETRKKIFNPVIGQGIFTTDGAAWEHSRAVLRPNFNRSQVGNLTTFETHIKHLIRAIPTDGSTVDLQALFFHLTLDSATEFLFGESASTLTAGADGKPQDPFGEAFNYCTEKIGKEARLGFRNFLPNRKYEDSKKVVHEFADRYVQKALEYRRAAKASGKDPDEKPDGRYIFLHELAKDTQDPMMLRTETLNILLAGRDTTASLLSDLWLILSRRPDVWEKLQAEVQALNGKKPTFEEMKDMKYLRYCLNESLRLFPVVPANSRTAIRDTVLPVGGGPDGKSPLFIPKNTIIGYHSYTLHRREDLYGPDAAEFKPERWSTIRPGWEYVPFNGGPRICLGQQFALTEASYTTVRLMQEFTKIESRDDRPWRELLTLTCASGHGAQVALSK